MKDLGELTTHCIRCGFCLEACPTFRETGHETESPRGRIYLVRSAVEGKLRWQEDVKPHLDRCLGCRACETACPSGVEYGAILELSRDHLDQERPSLGKRTLLRLTTDPNLLRPNLIAGRFLPGDRLPGFVARFFGADRSEVDKPVAQRVPDVPLDEAALPPVRGEVYLLEGCAMRLLFPRVHWATRRLLRRVGYAVREAPNACCGAMHAHNGELLAAQERAKDLVAKMPDDLPIIVNSAGCGSTMKEYDALIGESSFAKRVQDISEFLVANGIVDVLASASLPHRVTYHDACHLAHGQRITAPPRTLLAAIPGIDLVPLAESDMCCGSAGIYNVLQPEMARRLLDRKMKHVSETGAELVVLGNPGCHAWMAQGARERAEGQRVLHLAEALEAAFIGLEPFR